MWGDPLFQAQIDYSKIVEANQLYDVLMKNGVTHVMVNSGFDWEGVVVHELRYSSRILSMMDEMIVTNSNKIYDNKGVQVYELRK
jgi:hypothetical protein